MPKDHQLQKIHDFEWKNLFKGFVIKKFLWF